MAVYFLKLNLEVNLELVTVVGNKLGGSEFKSLVAVYFLKLKKKTKLMASAKLKLAS